MIQRFSLWKTAVVVVALVLGAVYGLPNGFPDDPALQVSASRSTDALGVSDLERARSALTEAGIVLVGEEFSGAQSLMRFDSVETQITAKAIVQKTLGPEFIVALNLAPTTPEWLRSIGASPMKLGLDLRGGVHFLMEVDLDAAVLQRLDTYASEIKQTLRKQRIRFRSVSVVEGGETVIRFLDPETRAQGIESIRKDYPGIFAYREREEDGAAFLSLLLAEGERANIENYAVSQNLTTLRNRVNELGVSEPLVQRQGANRIVVELPGVQDTATAKRVLGATANLEFRLEALLDAPVRDTQSFKFRDSLRTANLERDIITTGNSVSDARTSFDENGVPQVNISLDATGGRRMSDVTKTSVGRRMAVLFIESRTRSEVDKTTGEKKQIRFNEQGIISLATIQSVLGNQFRITGLDDAREASELALLLRAGALAAPIYFVEERTIGPSLGAENIRSGLNSVIIGFVLVMLFMLAFYRGFGLIANVALAVNLLLLIAVMSLLQAVLTLPGIAGIVLTVGMAVDANVLIFSRIREERTRGLIDPQAIKVGFEKAFITILDANVTTLLVAIILAGIGTGPVKGFAITLAIGICTSLFTATLVTRLLVEGVFGGRHLPKWAL
ncbi:protein translocase subunit SecD [Litorivicinus sp.]|nr:protein translocase subunit SecD [Litorivicinus sp.]MDC1209189.1 protein translocase subunit SecD [Litorivicinus sp.]MDC1240103.1 protein translocase subunit SecD [Litorivicinus sp.]